MDYLDLGRSDIVTCECDAIDIEGVYDKGGFEWVEGRVVLLYIKALRSETTVRLRHVHFGIIDGQA